MLCLSLWMVNQKMNPVYLGLFLVMMLIDFYEGLYLFSLV